MAVGLMVPGSFGMRRSADDRRLADRRILDALKAKLVKKPLGCTIGAAV